MAKKFFEEVYTLEGDARELYAQWATSYDEEVTQNGYVTPERCAVALREAGADPAQPVLDLGCGTGLGGLALKLAGFETVDGVDLTPQMVDQARERGIYRNLSVGDANDAMQGQSYHSVSAIGLFSPGHAPASLIDTVLQALPHDGLFVFSLNDHALADKSYIGRIMAWVDAGAARCLLREHGEHMPGQNVGATIYVLQKS